MALTPTQEEQFYHNQRLEAEKGANEGNVGSFADLSNIYSKLQHEHKLRGVQTARGTESHALQTDIESGRNSLTDNYASHNSNPLERGLAVAANPLGGIQGANEQITGEHDLLQHAHSIINTLGNAMNQPFAPSPKGEGFDDPTPDLASLLAGHLHDIADYVTGAKNKPASAKPKPAPSKPPAAPSKAKDSNTAPIPKKAASKDKNKPAPKNKSKAKPAAAKGKSNPTAGHKKPPMKAKSNSDGSGDSVKL